MLRSRCCAFYACANTWRVQAGRYVHKYFTAEGRLYERDEEKGGDFFYLLPKRTSLKHRLHADDRLFLDFIRVLLRLNPEVTNQSAHSHPPHARITSHAPPHAPYAYSLTLLIHTPFSLNTHHTNRAFSGRTC